MTIPLDNATDQPLLELRGVSRSFGGVQALHDVSLDVMKGEVHTLVGENGAGKSTLIKILSGIHQPEQGEFFFRGEPVRLSKPSDAFNLGISAVHQEFNYCPNLSVLENLYLGRDLPLNRCRMVNWRLASRHAREVLADMGVSVDLKAPMRELNSTHRKLIEIGRGLMIQASVLILDEPTAALPENDVEHLFEVIARLKAKGVSIIYISHHLKEIFRIANRVTVLRDGRKVATQPIAELTSDSLVRMMVGRTLDTLYPERDARPGEPVLEVSNLGRAGDFQDINFSLHKGEILGLAGLVGAGRSELAQAIAGIQPADTGSIQLFGEQRQIKSVAAAKEVGIAYVPEDRQHQGLILGMNIADNITLTVLKNLSRRLFLRRRSQVEWTRKYGKELKIQFAGTDQPVQHLSGGNQQKCLLAKWIGTQPRILIVDEPTRGIDVGAKAEIHALISNMAAQGTSIILISSELPEVLGMCDRILVLHEGRITGRFRRGEADQETILYASMGTDRQAATNGGVNR
jgi:rhamnose transport system ATP-binding protein